MTDTPSQALQQEKKVCVQGYVSTTSRDAAGADARIAPEVNGQRPNTTGRSTVDALAPSEEQALNTREHIQKKETTRNEKTVQSPPFMEIQSIEKFFVKKTPNSSALAFTKKKNVWALLYDEKKNQFIYKEIRPEVAVIGSKAFNLAFLASLNYVSVPKWSSISSSIFQEVVHRTPELQSDLLSFYSETEKYDAATDKNSFVHTIFRSAAYLRKKIETLYFSEDLTTSLCTLFNRSSDNGTKPIAVRSSALTEDLPGASFAGLYDSYLNIRDYTAFLDALKMCWASTFNDRAVQYYMQKGLSLRDVYMSVLIMELVDAEISGTAFTTDITTGYDGLHIMASNGLGAVVGGEITADSFLFHPESLMMLKRVRGSKEFRYNPNKQSNGLEKAPSVHGKSEYCLSVELAKEIAALVRKIGCDYQIVSQGPVDSEFAITKNGTIFFVQIRPVVMTATKQVDDVDFDILKDQRPKPIASGKHSVFGVKHGKIKIVEDFHDLESGKLQINSNDIVVTTRTENQWTQYLSQFSGIITTEGNPTSHPVLISRERKVPCLVGVADATGKFREYNGQWVTLDGFRNCVYPGKLPLKSISIDKINEAFKVVQEEKLQEEEAMIKDLFKKGFMIESNRRYWITGINSYFSGALLDMVANSYRLRELVINKSGITPKVSFQTEQMAVLGSNGQGKVYDHWWVPHVEQLKICQKMTLENCQKFYIEKGRKMEELLKVCQEFDLTLASWKKIREVYEELTAYQLLGFLERYPLIHSTYEFAKSLQIPRFFFEEYSASVSEYEIEEDVEYLNATKTLSTVLLQLASSSGKEIQEIDLNYVQKNVTVHDYVSEDPLDAALADTRNSHEVNSQRLFTNESCKVDAKAPAEEQAINSREQLQKNWSNFYEALTAFSKQYKFSKSEDWIDPPPIEKAFAKVLEQIKTNDFQIVRKKRYSEAEEDFFVDCPELRERIRLSIVKKLQQNNIHHIRQRAHWLLRDKLLMLGAFLAKKGQLCNPEDILSIPLEQLESHLMDSSISFQKNLML